MKTLRKKLSYANVMSTLFVFLALGGATAFAATQLAKNSVGTKQLKKNAVTTGKIKKNAVTRVKIKNGSVDGSKIADGSVTGTEINAGSTPFSQTTVRLRGSGAVPFTSGQFYQLSPSTYTQNAGEDNQFLGYLEVNFAASCTQPRIAQAYLMVDPVNPTVPSPLDVVGIGLVQDTGSGSVNRKLEFGSLPGGSPMSRFAPAAATQHTFLIYLAGTSCSSGSGITAVGAGVDVIGTK